MGDAHQDARAIACAQGKWRGGGGEEEGRCEAGGGEESAKRGLLLATNKHGSSHVGITRMRALSQQHSRPQAPPSAPTRVGFAAAGAAVRHAAQHLQRLHHRLPLGLLGQLCYRGSQKDGAVV